MYTTRMCNTTKQSAIETSRAASLRLLTVEADKQLGHVVDGHHRTVVELRRRRLHRLAGRMVALRRVRPHERADRGAS